MKTLCNKLMTLDSGKENHKDFCQVIFIFFINETKFYEKKKCTIAEFCNFVYRFYIDNKIITKLHSNRLFKCIELCNSKDLYWNVVENLSVIKEKTNLIDYDKENIFWIYDKPDYSNADVSLLKQVSNFLITKYLGKEFVNYTCKLSNDDYCVEKNLKNTRLLNRLLEFNKYCAVCEKQDVDKLQVVRLKDTNIENEICDLDNYILMCEKHCEMFKKGILVIDDTGKIYEDGRLINRLDINTVKRIRKYIRDI